MDSDEFKRKMDTKYSKGFCFYNIYNKKELLDFAGNDPLKLLKFDILEIEKYGTKKQCFIYKIASFIHCAFIVILAMIGLGILRIIFSEFLYSILYG